MPKKEATVSVLSPLAKNLFHRAISESGVALTAALVKKGDVKPLAEVGLPLDTHPLGSVLLNPQGSLLRWVLANVLLQSLRHQWLSRKGEETP
ncbi:hypothetical protein H8959_014208 [Pygathrix nigripes]